eukprot:m.77421 g.77421  ORF g.77421 m.77421 type:complete len:99 (-) comp8543_c0_seq6:2105-2401(-)
MQIIECIRHNPLKRKMIKLSWMKLHDNRRLFTHTHTRTTLFLLNNVKKNRINIIGDGVARGRKEKEGEISKHEMVKYTRKQTKHYYNTLTASSRSKDM